MNLLLTDRDNSSAFRPTQFFAFTFPRVSKTAGGQSGYRDLSCECILVRLPPFRGCPPDGTAPSQKTFPEQVLDAAIKRPIPRTDPDTVFRTKPQENGLQDTCRSNNPPMYKHPQLISFNPDDDWFALETPDSMALLAL